MAHPNIIEAEPALETIVRTAETVAVVGMKGDAEPEAPAHEIPKAIQSRGLKIIPINPKLEQSLGEKAYPSLAALGKRVDVVCVFRRSDAIPQVAQDVLALPEAARPAVLWMQEGIRNDAAAEQLAAAGIKVVQDRCLSVYTAKYRAKAAPPAI
jgi:predicted CoA-binding protein